MPIDNLTRYEVVGECWEWAGSLSGNGYGITSRPYFGTSVAHRVFYLSHVGPIGEGLDLDHLCRNIRCVNPAHLEPVTRSENLRRGLAGYGSRQTCRKGLHDLTLPNAIYTSGKGVRRCRECAKYQSRKTRHGRTSTNLR